MKKVFVEVRNGFPRNMDIQNAIDGFEYLNYDPKPYTFEDVVAGKMDMIALTNYDNIFVGGIDAMNTLLKRIDKLPEPIDLPMEILTNSDIVKRDIEILPLYEAIERFMKTGKPMFIKPVKTKLFDGILVSQRDHLHYLKGYSDVPVIVSSKLDIVSEHRIYIHKRKMIYSSCYSGDFKILPDFNYVDRVNTHYVHPPISYTIDVAVLKDGTTEVIELNDFWAIGSYGLYCIDYAEMLRDRYKQIMEL